MNYILIHRNESTRARNFILSWLEWQTRMVDPSCKISLLWRHRNEKEAINPNSIFFEFLALEKSYWLHFSSVSTCNLFWWKNSSDFFSTDSNRKYGIRIRGSHVKSFGLNNYRTTRARNFILVFPESLWNVVFFICKNIHVWRHRREWGPLTLILFCLITSTKHKLLNRFLHCYNKGSVTMTSYGEELFVTFWGLMGVKNPKFSWFVVCRSVRCQKAWEYRCWETIHSIVNSPWIVIWKTPIESGGIREYDDVIIFFGWLEYFSQFQIFDRRKSEFAATKNYWSSDVNIRLLL